MGKCVIFFYGSDVEYMAKYVKMESHCDGIANGYLCFSFRFP